MKGDAHEKRILAILLTLFILLGCGVSAFAANEERTSDIVVLFTSDVHCGIDQGFGYAGLWAVRDYHVAKGDKVFLVDNGDSIQGEPIGTLTKGEACIDLMNAMGYDVAIPGNHEFDYGGGVRVSIPAGDITLNNILSVHPFGNEMCVIEVTGQQILDALEWGSRAVPGETGGFLQVSGLSYEIHSYIESTCTMDENGMFTGVKGERRVKNVKIGGEDLYPARTYTLAGHNYMLLNEGDGFSIFAGANVLQNCVKLDNQVLIDYITDTLGGVIGEEYEDPTGQGRIVIVEEAP